MTKKAEAGGCFCEAGTAKVASEPQQLGGGPGSESAPQPREDPLRRARDPGLRAPRPLPGVCCCVTTARENR